MMAHNHNHEHSHGDHHGHSHAPASFGRAFAIGTSHLGFVIVEAVYGYLAHSLPCLPIAGHNLRMCWDLSSPGVQVPSRRPPQETTPMGYAVPQSWRLWGKVAQLFAPPLAP